MIRGLVLLVLLAGGLTAAAFYQGRMHHLRLALPETLPGWTRHVAADAGLRRGIAELPARGHWPATRLEWQARLPDAEGWLWDVALTGPGVALKGVLRADFLGETATLSNVAGSLDLAELIDSPVPVQGIARIDQLSAVVTDLRGAPRARGHVTAQVAAFRLEGADFGAGPLTAELDAEGPWRAQLRLSGGVSGLNAALTGALGKAMAQLEARFDDGPALPPAMRGMLAAVGQADGQEWRLSLPVRVP